VYDVYAGSRLGEKTRGTNAKKRMSKIMGIGMKIGIGRKM
jgi:hypothetical protein